MDLRKLESEVDLKRSVEVFETLRADTNLFTGWSRAEIEKLCENIKIISYGRSATIIRKNEIIEYFAIILGGKLLINQGNNVIGHLGAGDVIGYMACMDFAGTKASPFEITADVEGYIGVFRYDEFKMLSKKEPLLSYKITEMLAKKTLNTVALQYMGEELYVPHKVKGGSLVANTKKIKDAMDTCPELGEFFDRLDQRDRKNLVKCVEYIEFEAEQRVIHEGKKSDYILILAKGELIGFREGKPAVYYKPGTILGKKEFFFELTWTENVYGKAKGVMLKLERTKYQEMVMSSTMSANNLMKSLIWHECKDIKSRYQERSVFDKVKGQTATNPLNEFVEYEITKHMDFINKQQLKLSNNKPLIKEFMLKKEVLPLYMHSIHQALVAPPPAEQDSPGLKKPKAPETIAGCIFLREKMEKQIAERRNKKKTPGARPVKVVEPKRTAHDGIGDEDYEDLKNNYVLLEKENEELREKLNKIFDDNKGLKNQLRDLKELSVMSNTQINKTNLHKELMTKDLINNDPASFLTRNYSTTFSTFGDVLKEQHLVATRTKRVAKYAYRWLAVVRTKRKQKLLG